MVSRRGVQETQRDLFTLRRVGKSFIKLIKLKFLLPVRERLKSLAWEKNI